MKEIIYRYEKDPDYRMISANAFLGKKTMKGDLFIDLCLEHFQAPDEVIYSLTPEGRGREVSREPARDTVICEAQAGLLLSVQQAKELAYWILRELNDKGQG